MLKMMRGLVLRVSGPIKRVASIPEVLGFRKLKGQRPLSTRGIFSPHSLKITIRPLKVKQLFTEKVSYDINFDFDKQ